MIGFYVDITRQNDASADNLHFKGRGHQFNIKNLKIPFLVNFAKNRLIMEGIHE